MKSILVSSLPLKDVIKDIAKALKTDYSENCQEYILHIPKEYGSGTILGINFESGLGLIQYDCTFNEEMEFRFSVRKVHPLKFIYVKSGNLHHRFEHEENVKKIEQYQSVIVASSNYDGHILVFEKGKQVQIRSLEIDREKFNKKMSCEIKVLDKDLEKLFRDKQASESFYHRGSFSLEIGELVKNMDDFKETNFVRKLFLEGISYQLLTREILDYKDDKLDEGDQSLLRQSEIKQIHRVVEIIESDIANVATIDNLARNVGLNVNKLQHGFKYFFNQTVNEFIQKTRLDHALILLANQDLNISEISSMIGINSKSYFSKIFRERHGITPSEYRRKKLNKTFH